MLVLSRRQGERIVINGDVEVVVLDLSSDRVRLGFVAPDDIPIHREEVQQRIGRDDPPSSLPSPRVWDGA